MFIPPKMIGCPYREIWRFGFDGAVLAADYGGVRDVFGGEEGFLEECVHGLVSGGGK